MLPLNINGKVPIKYVEFLFTLIALFIAMTENLLPTFPPSPDRIIIFFAPWNMSVEISGLIESSCILSKSEKLLFVSTS